jgi:hypothetical protein
MVPHPIALSVRRANTLSDFFTDNVRNRALCITFYRPFLKDLPHGVPLGAHDSWRLQMQTKSEAAAFQTNVILEKIAREKLLSFAGPMT